MTDFHTHILPCMDDGSGSVGESAAMLREEMEQGIRNVVLTPHFHARDDSIPSFLCRRQQAWNHLLPHLPPQCPNLFLGAEVGYFQGISAAEGIRQLRVEGSSLLLLEMLFCRWTERMAEDVLKLHGREGIQVVLAHVERYASMQPKQMWTYLRGNGILMQADVSFLADWRSRHRGLRMISGGEIHFLGSDCHNMTNRRPNWDRLSPGAKAAAARCAAHFPPGTGIPAGWIDTDIQQKTTN